MGNYTKTQAQTLPSENIHLKINYNEKLGLVFAGQRDTSARKEEPTWIFCLELCIHITCTPCHHMYPMCVSYKYTEC